MSWRGVVVAVVVTSGCQSKGYPVHADLDMSVPNVFRVNVSTAEDGTVEILGTSSEARMMGKTSLAISTSQLPPGPQFIRVSFTTTYGAHHGSTIVEFNRPLIEPTMKVGSHGYHRDAVKCTGDVCDGEMDAPTNGTLKLPIDAPPGCVVEVLGKSTTIPVRYERFTNDEDFRSRSSTVTPEPPTLWIDVKDLDAQLPATLDKEKTPPVRIKAKVTCDDHTTDFSFALEGATTKRQPAATK